MKKFNAVVLKSVLLLSACGLFAGCASVTLDPGAGNIKIVEHQIPKNCRVVSKVSAYDIAGRSVTYMSHKKLVQTQLINMKNQALKLGANVIVITEHKTINGYPEYVVAQGAYVTDPREIGHIMAGDAYYCPAGEADAIRDQYSEVAVERGENE